MTCPACGTQNPEQAKFCLECGTSLVAPASQESRRTVTVVFADMVGFTSLGESLDQESLRRVMDSFYAEMRSAIEAHAGTLAKFIGDAVLAVWGTPVVLEDDALQAVRAADAMRGALASLNEDLQTRWGVRVGMRTGVNTGEVVVDPARPADLLVGDTLNVAARLEQAAADGEVLVGPETYRLVRDEMTLEAVAPLDLKGKAKPLPAWRVIDAQRPEQRSSARLLAPLVGRSDELARLWDAFRLVGTERACRMTTVIGSPGLGKTRLVTEFVRSVSDQATVLHGRCQATGEGITFQPVAEVLRAAAGIDDDDTPDAAREKLSHVLPDDEPDRERVIERAAALLGLAPIASTEETFWAMRRILEALARERPVVLVHDDIHWGQPTFLDLLEHFVQWIRDAPVLVLALARPELREVRPAFAEPGAVGDVLHLVPLDAAASRAMVVGLLGAADLPEGLAQRVLETTEGNPLFLGETLRMLADEGVLRREGDTWVAGDIGDVIVPPTINALLAARIQRLDNEERSVVERAAVIGHSFYRGAVAELAPPAVKPSVDDALETLSRKELVRPEDEWWLDEQVFRFHHVLIRDAAYRSLLKESRADLHQRFAAWLEIKAGELAGEHEEVIAFHLEQAHAYRLELGTLDEAGHALAAAAAARLHSAGRRALAREDLPAAANLLRRALIPLAGELAGRADVLVDLAEALLSAGDTAAAEEVVEKLGLAAEELGDERLRAWSVVFATQLDNLTGAGHVRASADAAARAAQVLADADDRAGEAKAHQVVAQSEALLGQVAAAEAALDRALVAARMAGDRRRITAVLSGAPRAALWGPAPIVRASGRCLDVVRILRMTPGNRHVEAAALRCQAVLEAMRGRADAARGILDNCRMTLEELGLTLELHETAAYAGIVELLAGEPAAAEDHLRRAHDGFSSLGVEAPAAQAAALMARALLDQGRDDEALAATQLAEQAGGEDLKTRSTWLGVRAEVLARRDEHEQALDLAQLAVAMTEPTDALADKADALMALAAVASAAGDEAGAHDAAANAAELYAAKDHTVGVGRAEAITGVGAVPAATASAPEVAPDGDEPAIVARRRRFIELNAQRNYEEMRELFVPDYLLVDTRRLGWEQWDRDTLVANSRSALEIGSDYSVRERTLAGGHGILASVVTFAGHSEEGAEWDNSFGLIEIGAGSRAVYSEVWDADDEAGILARFEELQPLAATATSGRSPEIAWGRFLLTYNARDWVAMRALVADDCRLTDHRQLGWDGVTGGDAYVEYMRSTAEVFPDIRSQVRSLLASSDRVIAGVVTALAHGEDGGEAELRLGMVGAYDEAGQLVSSDVYDPDDEAAMLARFTELRGTDTVAARRRRRVIELARGGEWDGLLALYDESFLNVDTRAIGWEAWDRERLVENFRSIGGVDDYEMSERTLAADDAMVCVVARFAGTSAEGAEWDNTFGVIEIGAGPTIVYAEVWDPDDEAAMLERFEELRPLAATATSGRSPEITWARYTRAQNARNWEAMRTVVSPDYTLRDHRQVGWEEIVGYDGLLELCLSGLEGMHDVRLRLERIEARSERVAAARWVFTGRHEEAGTMEIGFGAVETFDDEGRILRSELFAPEDEAGMLARFAEVRGTDTVAARRRRRVIELARGGEWDGLLALYDESFLNVDTRVIGWEAWDRERLVENFRSVGGVGEHEMSERTLAADDAVICAVYTVGGLSPENARWDLSIGIVEIGGEVAHYAEIWDPADEDALLARYETIRALAPTATSGRCPEVSYARFTGAYNRRDWDGVRAIVREDFTFGDRRQVGWEPVVGREALIGFLQSAIEAGGDMVFTIDSVLARDDRHLVVVTNSIAHGEGGVEFAVPLGVVLTFDDAGLSVALEFFEPYDDAGMLARFGELTGPAAPLEIPPLVRVGNRAWAEAFAARDWDRLGAFYAPDVILRDHRQGIRNEAHGREAVIATLTEAAPIRGNVLRWTPIAMPADNIVVVDHALGGDEDGAQWEIVLDQVIVYDSDLRVALVEIFDDRAALLARGDELATSPVPPWGERRRARFSAAFAARDWEAVRALFTDDCVMDDRRRGIGSQLGGVDEFLGSFLALAEQTDDATWELASIATAGEYVGITETTLRGTDVSGGDWEIRTITVGESDVDGCTQRVVALDEDCLDDAYKLMDAWAAERALRLAPWLEPDATTEQLDRWLRAFNAHDLDGLQARYHPDIQTVDHRPGIRNKMSGLEEVMGVWRWLFETVPDVRAEALVFQAAEDIGHFRLAFHSRDTAYEIGTEAVTRTPDGLTLTTDLYELGDLAAAEHFAALTGAGEPRAVQLARQWTDAFNTRNWERGAASQSPDYRSEERRRLSAAGGDGPDGIAQAQAIVEVSADARWGFEVLEAEGDAALMACTVEGHAVEGGEYSARFLQILIADRHGASRVIGFEESDLAEAETVYRAWVAHLRQARFQEEVMSTGDVDRMRDELYAPDFAQVDHRVTGGPLLDAEGIVTSMREAFGMAPDTQVTVDIVAVAGDRRAQRLTFRGHLSAGGGEVELELWTVTRIRGLRNVGGALFDTREEAETALATGAQRPIDPEIAETAVRWCDYFNARDWDGMRSMLTEDAVGIDLRSVSMGESNNPDEAIEIQKSMIAVAPDLRMSQRVLAAERLDDDTGILAAISTFAGGGDAPLMVETGLVLVSLATRSFRAENYDPDEAAVLARYDELKAELQHPGMHVLDAFTAAFNARDLDRIEHEVLAPGRMLHDHRAVGTVPLDVAAFMEALRTSIEIAPDLQIRSELLVAQDEHVLVLLDYRGTAPEGGGEVLISFYIVIRVVDGRDVGADVFATEEEARAWLPHLAQQARFEEIINAHDLDRLRDEILHPDFSQSDQRGVIGAPPIAGREAMLDTLRLMMEMSPDISATLEVVAVAGPRRVGRLIYRGHSAEGGGEAEVVLNNLAELADRRLIRSDLYPSEEAALAALSRVGVDAAVPGGDEDRAAGDGDAAEHPAA